MSPRLAPETAITASSFSSRFSGGSSVTNPAALSFPCDLHSLAFPEHHSVIRGLYRMPDSEVAAKCRKRAEEARRQAERCEQPADKSKLLRLAEAWEFLANGHSIGPSSHQASS